MRKKVLLAALALTACGDDSPPGTETETDAAAATDAAVAADAAPHADGPSGFAIRVDVSAPSVGQRLALVLNDDEIVAELSSGVVEFETHLAAGAMYRVEVFTAPAGAPCFLSNEQGVVVDADVEVDVDCPSTIVHAGPTIARSPVPGSVLFAANDGESGREVWATDGTVSERLTDIAVGVANAYPAGFIAYEGDAYFTATTTIGSRALWRTDGTTAGVAHVAEIQPDCTSRHDLAPLHLAGDSLIVWQRRESSWWHPLTSDGTTVTAVDATGAGQVHVSLLPFMPPSTVEGVLHFVGVGIDAADDVTMGAWTLDGTETGVQFLYAATATAGAAFPATLATEAGVYVAHGDTGAGRDQLWRVDVTPPTQVFFGGEVTGMAALGDDVLYGRSSSTFRLDGVELANVGFPFEFHGATALFQGTLLFAGSRNQLWRTDGTPEGTARVGDRNHGDIAELTSTPTFAAFSGWDSSVGRELWITDGTAKNTFVVDLRPGPEGSYPIELTAIDGNIWFAANDGAAGRELWVTDGTVDGTRRVTDINPGPADGL